MMGFIDDDDEDDDNDDLFFSRFLGADGILIKQHNFAAGGQEVMHVHFHIIPKFNKDMQKVKFLIFLFIIVIFRNLVHHQ
jgi:hypothetical protein